MTFYGNFKYLTDLTSAHIVPVYQFTVGPVPPSSLIDNLQAQACHCKQRHLYNGMKK